MATANYLFQGQQLNNVIVTGVTGASGPSNIGKYSKFPTGIIGPSWTTTGGFSDVPFPLGYKINGADINTSCMAQYYQYTSTTGNYTTTTIDLTKINLVPKHISAFCWGGGGAGGGGGGHSAYNGAGGGGGGNGAYAGVVRYQLPQNTKSIKIQAGGGGTTNGHGGSNFTGSGGDASPGNPGYSSYVSVSDGTADTTVINAPGGNGGGGGNGGNAGSVGKGGGGGSTPASNGVTGTTYVVASTFATSNTWPSQTIKIGNTTYDGNGGNGGSGGKTSPANPATDGNAGGNGYVQLYLLYAP